MYEVNYKFKITLFERLCLLFIRSHYSTDDVMGTTIQYKIFKGKLYFIKEYFTNN